MTTNASDPESQELGYEKLLEFYKALAHPARLRIAGRLALGACSLGELADAADQPAAAIPRHIVLLRGAGIVAELEPGQYALDVAGLRRRAKSTLDSPRTRALGGATDQRSKVLAAFFRGGRLTAWPSGDQRKLVILEEIARRFDPDRAYAERELNELIKPVYADYTTIRRALVDYHFMNRDHGVYWLGFGRPRPEDDGCCEEKA